MCAIQKCGYCSAITRTFDLSQPSLVGYMTNRTCGLSPTHMNQECIFELLYNNDKHRDDIKTIMILKYIFQSGQIVILNDSVIYALCKYCDKSIIMCFIKYFNGIINFDKIEPLNYAHIYCREYMSNIGVKYFVWFTPAPILSTYGDFDTFMKPKFLI